MVAVVSNDSGIKSKHDLKDKKLCHPGYESEVDSNRIISNVMLTSGIEWCKMNSISVVLVV